MILLFALASMSHCVSSHFCPTEQELLEAVKERDSEHDAAIMVRIEADNPGIFFVTERKHKTILSNIICGEPHMDLETTINCSFTAKYRGMIAYEVATLKRDGRWRISDYNRVERNRP